MPNATLPQFHTQTDEPIDPSILEGRARSVGHLFRDRVASTPDGTAFIYAEPRGDGEEWVEQTWREVEEVAYRWAAGLISLGVGLEDRVAIASGTRHEWALADLAVMCAGGATTTIYPTTIAGDVAFIISDSGSKVVFAEDDAQVEKLRGIREEIPSVVKVVTFTGDGDGDWVIGLDELARLGA